MRRGLLTEDVFGMEMWAARYSKGRLRLVRASRSVPLTWSNLRDCAAWCKLSRGKFRPVPVRVVMSVR